MVLARVRALAVSFQKRYELWLAIHALGLEIVTRKGIRERAPVAGREHIFEESPFEGRLC